MIALNGGDGGLDEKDVWAAAVEPDSSVGTDGGFIYFAVGPRSKEAGGLLRTCTRPTLNLLPLLLLRRGVIEHKHSTDVESRSSSSSGGLLRTSTRPTLNLLPLLRTSA